MKVHQKFGKDIIKNPAMEKNYLHNKTQLHLNGNKRPQSKSTKATSEHTKFFPVCIEKTEQQSIPYKSFCYAPNYQVEGIF
ncbi:hypothetical protein ESP60_05380 [Anaplasma phagocytophilum]|nr:hypothetical protein ESP60_05380 [Anaplasma phagocytophilum]